MTRIDGLDMAALIASHDQYWGVGPYATSPEAERQEHIHMVDGRVLAEGHDVFWWYGGVDAAVPPLPLLGELWVRGIEYTVDDLLQGYRRVSRIGCRFLLMADDAALAHMYLTGRCLCCGADRCTRCDARSMLTEGT